MQAHQSSLLESTHLFFLSIICALKVTSLGCFIMKVLEGHRQLGYMNLTLYLIEAPLKYHVFENIMENGAFALLDFPLYFQKYSKFFLIFFLCLKVGNYVMI